VFGLSPAFNGTDHLAYSIAIDTTPSAAQQQWALKKRAAQSKITLAVRRYLNGGAAA